MFGRCFYFGFSVEGNAKSGKFEHGQVVGSVTDGNNLFKMYILLKGNKSEQFGFLFTIYYLTYMPSCEFAILNLKFVGKDIVNIQLVLEVIAEIGKSP